MRIIVPFAPGGLNDIAARLFADHLGERMGRQFIVENRTGAGGVVGSEMVANSPPDGYTLLIASIAHAVNPSLYKLPYDLLKAFDPVGKLRHQPQCAGRRAGPAGQDAAGVHRASPRRSRAALFYASGGIGGSLHLGFELFKNSAGVDLVHVPFKGAGPAVINVAGSHSQAIIATITTLVPHHRAQQAAALGGRRRDAQRLHAGPADLRGAAA